MHGLESRGTLDCRHALHTNPCKTVEDEAMRRRRSRLAALLVLLLSLPLQARARSPPWCMTRRTGPLNMAQVAQSIIIVANQILDLTAIGDIVIAADDVRELAGIIEEASALKYDFVQLHNQVQSCSLI